MDRRPYAVVSFTEYNESLAVVPVKWLGDPDSKITESFWPPNKGWPIKGSRSVQLKKAVLGDQDADPNWPMENVSVLHKYKTYDDAVRGCKKAEVDSNLDTEAEPVKRRVQKPERYRISDKESDASSDQGGTGSEEDNNKILPIKSRKRVAPLTYSDDEPLTLKAPKVSLHVIENVTKKSPLKTSCGLVNKAIKESQIKVKSKSSTISSAKARALGNLQNSEKDSGQSPLDFTFRPPESMEVTAGPSSKPTASFPKKPKPGKKQNFKRAHNTGENQAMSTSPFKVTPLSNANGEVETTENSDILKTVETHIVTESPLNSRSANVISRCGNLRCTTSGHDLIANTVFPDNSSPKNMDTNMFSFTEDSSSVNDLPTLKRTHHVRNLNYSPPAKPPSKNKTDDDLKLISVTMLEMNSKLDAALLNQAVIIRAVDPNLAKVIRPEQLPKMPMKSVEDLEVMEKFLSEPTNFAALRDRLWMSSGGDSDERKATGKMLSKLFTNNLAKDVSWKGSDGQKVNFSSSKTCEAVFSAVALRFKGTQLTGAEDKIKDWFRTAPEKYRKEKGNKNASAEVRGCGEAGRTNK